MEWLYSHPNRLCSHLYLVGVAVRLFLFGWDGCAIDPKKSQPPLQKYIDLVFPRTKILALFLNWRIVIIAADNKLKDEASMHVAQASSKLKGGKKKGFKQDGKQVAIGVNKVGNKVAKYKFKGNCYHCGKVGHLLRNCPNYLAFRR